MLEFYPQIKWVHIACIIASGALFVVRGLLMQVGRDRIALATPLRWLSYTIDTTLLGAALTLATILPNAMFANGWLATKLLFVTAYVGLGMLAMRRESAPGIRRLGFAGAMLTYITIIGIALAHHPLGWIHLWLA